MFMIEFLSFENYFLSDYKSYIFIALSSIIPENVMEKTMKNS